MKDKEINMDVWVKQMEFNTTAIKHIKKILGELQSLEIRILILEKRSLGRYKK